ncbi:hypothetical protein, partial [Acidithiobacillus ferridurans]|uniref:hypothetical protein n=1 Tax=Acidithiobacillus ferridurans TaxID=1232575 RepID=UPI001C071D64
CFAGSVPVWRAEGLLDASRDAFPCRSTGAIFAGGTGAAGAGGDGGTLTIRKAEGAATVLVTS